MKNYGLFALIVIFITSCTSHGSIQPRATDASLNETWMQQLNTNPDTWIKHADPWFLTGEPNRLQQKLEHAPPQKNVITSSIKATDFTDIMIHGNFQVQLVGGQKHNSVYLFGPKKEINQIAADLSDHRLMLRQKSKGPGNVIVRIGIHELRNLTNMGHSLVLGRTLSSRQLNVTNLSAGSIYLGGKMTLKQVENNGPGTITIIGAISPRIQVSVIGDGNVNLEGRIGVETILHHGNGNIHIIGADTDRLCISTSGSGSTTVSGIVKLHRIEAKGNSQLFVNSTASDQLHITQKDHSVVGLAGSTKTLYLDLVNHACFLGQHLASTKAYVKTSGNAHANLSANQEMFASASNKSTILYYGAPNTISPYATDQASIVAIGDNGSPRSVSTTIAVQRL